MRPLDEPTLALGGAGDFALNASSSAMRLVLGALPGRSLAFSRVPTLLRTTAPFALAEHVPHVEGQLVFWP